MICTKLEVRAFWHFNFQQQLKKRLVDEVHNQLSDDFMLLSVENRKQKIDFWSLFSNWLLKVKNKCHLRVSSSLVFDFYSGKGFPFMLKVLKKIYGL